MIINKYCLYIPFSVALVLVSCNDSSSGTSEVKKYMYRMNIYISSFFIFYVAGSFVVIIVVFVLIVFDFIVIVMIDRLLLFICVY